MTTRRNHVFAWLGYFAALALALYGMTEARRWAMAELDTPEARARQREWQETVAKQIEDPKYPVKRRPVKSAEPPMLRLLRDHFAAACAVNLLAVTIFYWFFTFIIRGMLRAKQLHARPSDSERVVQMIAGSSEPRA